MPERRQDQPRAGTTAVPEPPPGREASPPAVAMVTTRNSSSGRVGVSINTHQITNAITAIEYTQSMIPSAAFTGPTGGAPRSLSGDVKGSTPRR